MPALYSKCVALVIAAVALIFICGSLKMPLGTVLTPAAGLVPLLLGGGALVLAIVAMVSPEPARGQASAISGGKGQDGGAGRVPRPLRIMIVLGAMIFAFERAGFILSLLFGSFVLLRFVEKKPLLLSLVISLALSGGLYFLFSRVLYVNLPSGWLEF